MKKIKIIIAGVFQKLAKDFLRAAIKNPGVHVVGVTSNEEEASSILRNKKFTVTDINNIESVISKADMLVDFTSSNSLTHNLRICRKLKKPIIIYSNRIRRVNSTIKNVSNDIPIVLISGKDIGSAIIHYFLSYIVNTSIIEDRIDIRVSVSRAILTTSVLLRTVKWVPGNSPGIYYAEDVFYDIDAAGIETAQPLRKTKEKMEKQALIEALATHNNNVSKVARVLGITRPTVYALRKKYNI